MLVRDFLGAARTGNHLLKKSALISLLELALRSLELLKSLLVLEEGSDAVKRLGTLLLALSCHVDLSLRKRLGESDCVNLDEYVVDLNWEREVDQDVALADVDFYLFHTAPDRPVIPHFSEVHVLLVVHVKVEGLDALGALELVHANGNAADREGLGEFVEEAAVCEFGFGLNVGESNRVPGFLCGFKALGARVCF